MLSPALSVSSIVRPQYSAFAGQIPALAYPSLPNLPLNFVHSPSTLESEVGASGRLRYKADEEERLRDQILGAEMSLASSTLGIPDMLYELGGVLIEQGRSYMGKSLNNVIT
jgi:hypothetical protein